MKDFNSSGAALRVVVGLETDLIAPSSVALGLLHLWKRRHRHEATVWHPLKHYFPTSVARILSSGGSKPRVSKPQTGLKSKGISFAVRLI